MTVTEVYQQAEKIIKDSFYGMDTDQLMIISKKEFNEAIALAFRLGIAQGYRSSGAADNGDYIM